ncbi:2-oxopent-4-enoate hydratase [Chromobacterium sp. ATCC 53434]|uniref:fumarylacetoacetate hydrolase family protein n=1 Tax=Chromobacterium sp. (strain ATCC 53434 / SC 14030) TaxID=2059672 RepID=UPI000C77457A|nr:fumarylacetoacetate hydrolase family protein [Chromobacterium sp. ATCC 53434]AUH50019.1 2-oxopent-4-enoate hydratase [Chromobacterium sp. ATCC 53434]
MDPSDIKRHGAELYQALLAGQPVPPLSSRAPGMTLDDAYLVQTETVALRLADRHERVLGRKIGVTSQAVMDLLRVDQPDFGVLTSGMACQDGAVLSLAPFISPKAEGEIAFILKHELSGPGVMAADVLRATECVMPCIELVDSRIEDWKITIVDTVADNASSGAFVLGDQAISPSRMDLYTVGMTLERNGEIVATGAGAAALGHPANAVAWLANALGRHGQGLRAGELVLSGSLATMIAVSAGDNLLLRLGGIGTASVRFGQAPGRER